MIVPPRVPLDVAALLALDITWTPVAGEPDWFRAVVDGATSLHLRMNPEFPETDLYSLLVAPDETHDLNDLPTGWRVLRQ